MIRQALLQVLKPHLDATFSEASFGFRPGRSAHQAIELARFLTETLRLTVNRDKSAVERPWNRKFLSSSFTTHQQPRFKVAPQSVTRLKERLRELFRTGRGRAVGRTVTEMTPILRGWLTYFRNVDVRVTFEELDQWIRRKLRNRKLRCILWRQWKRPKTRLRELTARGLAPERAKASSVNGRGP